MRDLVIQADKARFNPDKHYLGALCIRGHDFEGSGKSQRHRKHRSCVECTRERAISWKAENPERAAANTARRDALRAAKGLKRNRRERYPFATHLGSVRTRAKEKSLPFDLTPDDLRRIWITQEGLCYWTGTKLDFYVGGPRSALRPSLDRLIPEKGYTKGNVVWTTNFANRGRGDTPAAEFSELLRSLGLQRSCSLT